MKSNQFIHKKTGFALAAVTFAATLAWPGSLLGDTKKPDARNNTARQNQNANATDVRVTRASNFLGADVTSSDGRKIGDIVDYVLDTSGDPHLAYVLVMTGGFLDMGGDVRAVPAGAISTQGDGAKIRLSSSDYWDVPVLPQDRHRYLSDRNNADNLAQRFKQAMNNNETVRNTREDTSAGAPTGRTTSARHLVAFSELRNAPAYSTDGNRLGYIVDAWINLDRNRAPYFEITGTYQPFRTNYDTRFAIPTAKIEEKTGALGYNVHITEKELNDAKMVSETDGVEMLKNNRFEDAVLRVTVPKL